MPIATCSVAQAKKLLDGDTMALNTLKEQIASYRSEKKDLLKKAGLSADYLETSYKCPDCKDTGFIDGKRCHCFTQAAIDLVYTQSNLKSILLRENFSTFSFDYYSDKDINPATGLSSLATAKDAPLRNVMILLITLMIHFPICTFTEIPASAKRFCQTVLQKS